MRIDPNPAPIVRQQQMDRRELATEVATIITKNRQRDQVTLSDALRAGRMLNQIKETCKHGEWKVVLDEYGIPLRTAQVYRRITTLAEPDLEGCESVADALKLCKQDEDGNEDEETRSAARAGCQTETKSSEGDKKDDQQQGDAANNGQPAPSNFCERCQRVGPVAGCKACEELATARYNRGHKPPKRKDKPGAPAVTPETLKEALGRARRVLDAAARQFGLQPPGSPIRADKGYKEVEAALEEAIKQFVEWYRKHQKEEKTRGKAKDQAGQGAAQ